MVPRAAAPVVRLVTLLALLVWGLAAPAHAAPPAAAPPNPFGQNTYVFTPDMPQAQIQATVDRIATQQKDNQFGSERYALLFAPGTYGSAANPLNFQVGYYTEVAGLGRNPGDVTINGSVEVYNRCVTDANGSTSCYALDNFWRSLSNMKIALAGKSGCQASANFWATSQAASLRRVQVTGGNLSLMDYCSAGPQYASGGFIADSDLSAGTTINGSQQQFLVRDSKLGGWSNGVWNQVFSGVENAPAQSFGQPGGQPYTTLPRTELSRERPYLYLDASGQYQVLVPTARHQSSGTTWANGPTAGTSIPLSDFLIANPATSARDIDKALKAGKNLLLAPGVYDVSSPIHVKRADTVVLGLGFPTLRPTGDSPVLHTASVPGIKVAGLIVDAGPAVTPTLVQLGDCGKCAKGSDGDDPTTLNDVYLRIGGASAGRTQDALTVNASDVVLDNIWSWRADHGTGVGWSTNTADRGLVVNGDRVHALGLFVEHYQKDNVVWNGEDGRVVFFQNEFPYDPPSQAAWSASPTIKGYAAFLVSPGVQRFTGWGMGAYSFFNQGVDIHATRAFQVPVTPGVRMHDLLTVFLNGSGGIDSVVNGVGAPVTQANSGQASQVVSYP
ncbi:adenylyl cyclase [Luteipulveratus sp. YIM 133132]|uniref:adenylyl cyclase n=1 Tax=Luteipulveratus flavus TaxID=3031728 RepID=UPI0023B17A69|nr:adenylyl cyclase [Luteipulveratus sp. YIM 133132]MDE9364030.1 adenylyl cyclase [Luteipulveratus sp. YIM 133132]